MVRKGYIEQQIEALGRAMAKILLLRSGGDRAGAVAEIRAAGKRLVGIDLDTLARLPDPTLLTLFRTPAAGGAVDAGRCVTASRLLAEQARVEQADENLSGIRRRKALLLLLEALSHEESLRTPENEAQLDDLVSVLGENAGGAPGAEPLLLRRVMHYYEQTGRRDRAEAVLPRSRQAPPGAAAADERF
jgi:hypothetical protein